MIIIACDRCGEQIHKTDIIYNVHMVSRHMNFDGQTINFEALYDSRYVDWNGIYDSKDAPEISTGLLCIECFKAIKNEVFKKSKM